MEKKKKRIMILLKITPASLHSWMQIGVWCKVFFFSFSSLSTFSRARSISVLVYEGYSNAWNISWCSHRMLWNGEMTLPNFRFWPKFKTTFLIYTDEILSCQLPASGALGTCHNKKNTTALKTLFWFFWKVDDQCMFVRGWFTNSYIPIPPFEVAEEDALEDALTTLVYWYENSVKIKASKMEIPQNRGEKKKKIKSSFFFFFFFFFYI